MFIYTYIDIHSDIHIHVYMYIYPYTYICIIHNMIIHIYDHICVIHIYDQITLIYVLFIYMIIRRCGIISFDEATLNGECSEFKENALNGVDLQVQCVAVHCSASQCVAVCGGVLQCVAV